METVVVAIVAFFSAIVGGFLNERIANRGHEEAKRAERTKRLADSMSALVGLFADFQSMIVTRQANKGDLGFDAEHARIIGKAIALLLSVDDDVLRDIAINRLVPYLVDDGVDPQTGVVRDWANINRNALVDALARLGKIIKEESAITQL